MRFVADTKVGNNKEADVAESTLVVVEISLI